MHGQILLFQSDDLVGWLIGWLVVGGGILDHLIGHQGLPTHS